MIKLMVSYDCGASYHCEATASTPEELEALKEKADEFSEQGLRWAVEDEDENNLLFSPIHRQVIANIAALNERN